MLVVHQSLLITHCSDVSTDTQSIVCPDGQTQAIAFIEHSYSLEITVGNLIN